MLPAAFSLLFAAALVAQAPEPRVQPSRIDLGVVRVGAVVEGTLHVYWQRPADGAEAVVESPPSLRQLEARTYEWDQGNVRSTIGFAAAADRVGKQEGTIAVRLGPAQATVTVSWTVEPAIAGGSRVLIAESPFVGDSTDDTATFDAWRGLVERARLDIDYRYSRKGVETFTVEALARVDVVIVGEDSLVDMTPAEVARLQGFVCGGGRVVVFASRFFGRTVPCANRLCEPFGLSMVDRELPTMQMQEAAADDVHKHALTAGITSVSAHRPSPTILNDPAATAPLVTLPAFGSERQFAAIATTKSGGEMVTVGVAMWWLWAGHAPGNERLLRNLLVRAPRLR